MSLPPAKQDISAHPAAGTVTDPVDKQKLERDVSQKLKLYASIQALRASRLPSNAQVDNLLSYFQQSITNLRTVKPSSTQPEKKEEPLSKDTIDFFADVTEILEALRAEVHSKNSDEIIQNLVWEARSQDLDEETEKGKKTLKERAKEMDTPVEQEKAKEDGRTALNHIRTLLTLVLTNSEARKLISDSSLVGRDLLARGASKAAANLAPSQEKMANVDSHIGPGEQAFVPKEQLDDEIARARERVKREKAKSAEQGQEVLEANRPGIEARAEQEIKERTGADVDINDATGTSPEDRQVKEGVQEDEAVVDAEGNPKKPTGGFLGKLRGKGEDQTNRGRQYLTEEYFPAERRDQWIWRGKKVIAECQSHNDYQESVRWLIDFVQTYTKHGTAMAGSANNNAKDAGAHDAAEKAFKTTAQVLDRFADGKSVENLLWKPIKQILEDAQKDEELRNWINEFGDYVKDLLLQPGYVTEKVSTSRGRSLLDRGKVFYTPAQKNTETDPSTGTQATVEQPSQGKYKTHFDAVFDGGNAWLTGWQQNAENKRLAQAVQQATSALLFTPDGRITFKADVWSDLRRTVVPALVDKVGYVPIPRIEYTDDQLDLVVENLTLSGRNLIPSEIAIEVHNYVKFGMFEKIRREQDDSRHEFIITLSQIQADMRDVAFYFKKKSGMPKLKDSGLADVLLGGEGLTVTIHVSSTPAADKQSIFRVKDVHVKISSLKFSIRDSKHDLLYKTVKPLATGLIKKQITKAIKDAIVSGLGVVDEQLVSARDRAQEARRQAAENAETGSTSSTSRFSAYTSIFKRNADDAQSKASSTKEKAASAKAGSQFKVVPDKRHSLLANAGHPAGWVNRVPVKEEFVPKEGDNSWKCDAFELDDEKNTAKA